MNPPRWLALGAYLAAARRRTFLTQHEVARQVGISQAAYSQIERGLVRPRPENLYRLSVALSLNLGRLATLAHYPLEQIVLALSRLP